MSHPAGTSNFIDVTKPPYCADNTGKNDCTAALCRVFDDLLKREIEGIRTTAAKLEALPSEDGFGYVGFEDRKYICNGRTEMDVIFPEITPEGRNIYFPAGIYLVSNTVSYTLTDLKNIRHSKPFYELTRGIRIFGDGAERTVIRLADGTEGFENARSPRAVLAFTTHPEACLRETSNVSQMNVCRDLTVDCGKGNPGAIALRFVANNTGNVENVTLKGENCAVGLQLACATEGVFRNLSVDGFGTGIAGKDTSVCVFDGVKMKNVKSKAEPEAEFVRIFRETEFPVMPVLPAIPVSGLADCAYVEAFGAVGDGKTDCTEAIRRAFRSGKPTILFGGGKYLVNGRVPVPASVRRVDFRFCEFYAGAQLISGEADALFFIDGESEDLLTMENLYCFEQFYGHFHLICHAARRDLFLKNLHTQTAAMYQNTVSGSRLWIDNCACTTGTYSMDTILARRGLTPAFCHMIPYEFHGQTVMAYQLNPERADVEILNDGSDLTVYGLKVEGPGTAVRTVNGGRSEIHTFSAGIGNAKAENALLFTDETSESELTKGKAFWGYRKITEKRTETGTAIAEADRDPFLFDVRGGMVQC